MSKDAAATTTTPNRTWGSVALVLGAIVIVLMGLVIHLKTSERSCTAVSELPDWYKYSWLFRREPEQRKLETSTFREVHGLSNAMDVIEHACCHSETKSIRPDRAVTWDNVTVTVIQNVNSRYQYFTVDTCEPKPVNCKCNCQCELRETLFTAYVQFPQDNIIDITQIKVPSTCKCVNRQK